MSYVAGDTVTLWIPLRDAAGAVITSAINANFTNTIRHTTPAGVVSTPSVSNWAHVSNGLYSATISPAVEGTYAGVVDYAGPPVQPFVFDIPVISEAQADPMATVVSPYAATTAGGRLARIGLNVVQVSMPLADSGDLRIYAGDDYATADDRSPEFDLSDAPDLTGATVTLLVTVGSVSLSKPATVSGAGTAFQTARVEFTAAETADLPATPKLGRYDLSAALDGGNVVTLARGKVFVTEDMA